MDATTSSGERCGRVDQPIPTNAFSSSLTGGISMTTQSILVTGGNGTLGRAVVTRLLAGGHQVRRRKP